MSGTSKEKEEEVGKEEGGEEEEGEEEETVSVPTLDQRLPFIDRPYSVSGTSLLSASRGKRPQQTRDYDPMMG